MPTADARARPLHVASGEKSSPWAAEVERLCAAYSHQPAPELLVEVKALALRISTALRDDPTADGDEGIRLLGWLSLVRACLLVDLGQCTVAEVAIEQAREVAADVGDTQVAAWTHEIAAWIALVREDVADAVQAATTGLDLDPGGHPAAQLHAQRARAYARMGQADAAREDLARMQETMAGLPRASSAGNHFVLDRGKAALWTMDVCRVLGDDAGARVAADRVISTSTSPEGDIVHPMRLAEALLTEAVLEVRAGELQRGIRLAYTALEIPRRSLPSLQLVGNEVADEIGRHDRTAGVRLRQAVRRLVEAPPAPAS